MSSHDGSKGPFPSFDPSDPLSMMGAAIVGLTLQEMAEREEHERRARLTPWERAAEDRRNTELAGKAWVIAGLVFGAAMLLLCLFLAIASTGY